MTFAYIGSLNMAKKLLLLNGPNLNLLGTREPEVYGKETLADIEQAASAQAGAAGATLSCFQSNHEGALIDRIHAAKTEGVDAIVLNPGGLTHTSVALRHALAGVAIPSVDVTIPHIPTRAAIPPPSLPSTPARDAPRPVAARASPTRTTRASARRSL